MTIFYKATDTNGTDFYTGSVNYAAALASGEALPALSCKGPFPGMGWYHLATVPTECVGMSWPCRLFEVEPVGDVFMDNAHPRKIGARSVLVVREIEAHRVFGPQGEQVVALIERCRTLSGAEADRLSAAWGAVCGADRDAALDTARGAARYAAWVAAGGAAWVAAWGAALGRRPRDATRNAWDGVLYAVRDAAGALLCRDLTGQAPGWDQDMYDLLTGPWRDVIGPIHPDDGDIPDDGDDDE